LFETEHGRLLAILDATTVTAIRTAAVSGVATRLLAREDAEELAILGAGTQGRTHLEAMTVVRPIRRVWIWSRTTEHARALAQFARERFDVSAEVCATPAQAVANAAIVCTATASPTPILEGAWLAPGTHVNAVGACIPTTRELDTEVVRRARLYVDRRESALAEPGDILMPLSEGAITPAHIIAEIGALMLEEGASLGRQSDDAITLFKSLGLAVEDVAAAHHVYHKARQNGLGAWVTLGGERDEAPSEAVHHA
jgi:ornithine cyclodeaminase